MDINKEYLTDWTKLEESSAKFIFDECEKNLRETIKTAELHTDRAIIILKFSIPVMVVLIAFVSTGYDISTIKMQLTLMGIIFAGVVIAKSIDIFNIYNIRPIGNTGDNLLKDDYVNDPDQNLLYLFNAIRTCDSCIEDNRVNNSVRLKKLSRLITTLRFGLVFTSTYAVISLLLTPFHHVVRNLVLQVQVEEFSALLSLVVALVVALVVEYCHR